MKVVKPAPIPAKPAVSTPDAKYFIDSLRRIKNASPKDLTQTTRALQNLIRKGLRFKMAHPDVRNAFAAVFVCEERSTDKMMEKAFLNAFDGMKFDEKEGFLTAGYLYNGLYFSDLKDCDEVCAVMQEIMPRNWNPYSGNKKAAKAA